MEVRFLVGFLAALVVTFVDCSPTFHHGHHYGKHETRDLRGYDIHEQSGNGFEAHYYPPQRFRPQAPFNQNEFQTGEGYWPSYGGPPSKHGDASQGTVENIQQGSPWGPDGFSIVTKGTKDGTNSTTAIFSGNIKPGTNEATLDCRNPYGCAVINKYHPKKRSSAVFQT